MEARLKERNHGGNFESVRIGVALAGVVAGTACEAWYSTNRAANPATNMGAIPIGPTRLVHERLVSAVSRQPNELPPVSLW